MENVIYSIAAAVIGLGLLIVFHEFGHFLLAKLCRRGRADFLRRLRAKNLGQEEGRN